ncbi:THAP domain-containing protein 2-like [Penaeus monodon]|uniref:THAP domain-containing protein 2-like n=1 Tax=Penaeus monodon TaxID=6687 RepID=UPI0018A75B1A|nr:THAP domain-containing protein 2-like [Penaeus monodon]
MVNSCIIIGCANRQVKGLSLSFCRLPKCPERRRLWLAAIRRKDYNPPLDSYARVCGIHFISGNASGDKCSPDYVPTLDMGYEMKNSSASASKQAVYKRGLKGDFTKKINEQESY